MQKISTVRRGSTFEHLLIQLGFAFLLVLSGFISQCWGVEPIPLQVTKVGLEMEGKLSGFFESARGIGSKNEVVVHHIIDQETGIEVTQKLPGRLTYRMLLVSCKI